MSESVLREWRRLCLLWACFFLLRSSSDPLPYSSLLLLSLELDLCFFDLRRDFLFSLSLEDSECLCFLCLLWVLFIFFLPPSLLSLLVSSSELETDFLFCFASFSFLSFASASAFALAAASSFCSHFKGASFLSRAFFFFSSTNCMNFLLSI